MFSEKSQILNVKVTETNDLQLLILCTYLCYPIPYLKVVSFIFRKNLYCKTYIYYIYNCQIIRFANLMFLLWLPCSSQSCQNNKREPRGGSSVARSAIKWIFIPCSSLNCTGGGRGVQFKEERGMKIHCGAQRSYNASSPKGQFSTF